MRYDYRNYYKPNIPLRNRFEVLSDSCVPKQCNQDKPVSHPAAKNSHKHHIISVISSCLRKCLSKELMQHPSSKTRGCVKTL